MLRTSINPFKISITEPCNLSHEPQVIEIDIPANAAEYFYLKDKATSRLFPVQRSKQNAKRGFLFLSLSPFEQLQLEVCTEPFDINNINTILDEHLSACTIKTTGDQTIIANSKLAFDVVLGNQTFTINNQKQIPATGPIRAFRTASGPWRGRTFFETQHPVKSIKGEIIEQGALRIHYRFTAAIENGQNYQADLILDVEQEFIKIDEQFNASPSDQLVWDFTGDNLPDTFYTLDETAAYRTAKLQYHFDQLQTRLCPWTQYSQRIAMHDGYAFKFGNFTDVAGVVALEGGLWRGSSLNHIEAWTRRWIKGDPLSRRNVPFEAKADSAPSPEIIPARAGSRCEEHFNLEAWIGQGRRVWALVLSTHERIQPPCLTGKPARTVYNQIFTTRQFDPKADRVLYKSEQSLLRRIHTQRGLMPLQDMLAMHFAWPLETPARKPQSLNHLHPAMRHHYEWGKKQFADPTWVDTHITELVDHTFDYLEARVYGVWDHCGSGSANCVVGRAIVPEMILWEGLIAAGKLTDPARIAYGRALFMFLINLFASENYYTGMATMLPPDNPDSVDPMMAGMANQNFYTDVITVPGMAAQVFFNHPKAAQWRDHFNAMWRRQLEYHTYPKSGLWEESHTYYHHVLHTILPLLIRRRDDDVDDWFADSAFLRAVTVAIDQLTPRDTVYNRARYLVPFGDHEPDPETYHYIYGLLAHCLAPHHPDAADRLAWAYGQTGGTPAELAPLALPVPAAMRLESSYIEGLGIMLRGHGADGSESLLALHSGTAWAHHHNDDSAIQLFAQEQAVIIEAGYGSYVAGPKKFSASGHSRWSLADSEPCNVFWRFNRGWVIEHNLAAAFPYAIAWSPAYRHFTGYHHGLPNRTVVEHFRTVVALSAQSWLVIDTAHTIERQVVRFYVPAAAATVDKCTLTVPLSASDGALTIALIATDEPEPKLEVLATSAPNKKERCSLETLFSIGTASYACFFIHVGSRTETLQTLSTGDTHEIRCGETAAAVTISTPEQICIRDLATQQQQMITVFRPDFVMNEKPITAVKDNFSSNTVIGCMDK